MTDLADFLLARIADDEAVARAAGLQSWSNRVPGMVHADAAHDMRAKGYYVAGVDHDEQGTHIARHDPNRVLAECEGAAADREPV